MSNATATVSEQVVQAITDFIDDCKTKCSGHNLILEMSSLTYNFLAAEDPSLILDPNLTPHFYKNMKSLKTKLGFPFPKPDGLMSVPYYGTNCTVLIYLDNKMKLMKLRMKMVQVIHKQKVLNP